MANLVGVFLLLPALHIAAAAAAGGASSAPNVNKGGNRAAGFFGPVGGFRVPGVPTSGFGNGIPVPGKGGIPGGGGYGGGYGGPSGGRNKGGTFSNPPLCSSGPCSGKKMSCPTSCFHSYSRSGRNGGGGGGGGGCNVNCKTCSTSCA